jgi:hypothetical protein
MDGLMARWKKEEAHVNQPTLSNKKLETTYSGHRILLCRSISLVIFVGGHQCGRKRGGALSLERVETTSTWHCTLIL